VSVLVGDWISFRFLMTVCMEMVPFFGVWISSRFGDWILFRFFVALLYTGTYDEYVRKRLVERIVSSFRGGCDPYLFWGGRGGRRQFLPLKI